MISKIMVIVIMLLILFALGSGLFYLITDDGKGERIVKALTWRIGLSLFLFFFLIGGYFVGIFHPHGL